jgi:hypothetical protein
VAPLGDGSRRKELSVDGGGSCSDKQARAGFEQEELSVDPLGGEHDRNSGGIMEAVVAGSVVERGLDRGPIRAGSEFFLLFLD